MDIVIKSVVGEPNKSILYLQTPEGNNVQAEIVDSEKIESVIINDWKNDYDIVKVTDLRTNKVDYNINKDNPLILVFYLYRDLMGNPEIMGPFSESVNNLIHDRGINAVAFFLPTDDNERIECINPVILPENEINKVNRILSDLTKQFGLDN